MAKRDVMPTQPPSPTMVRNRWADGRVLGLDGSVWLCRAVPLGPVDDARSEAAAASMAEPLAAAFEEVSTLAGPIRLTRRASAKAAYRDVQVLMVNMPALFVPARDSELAVYHAQLFPARETTKRVVLFMVKLVSRISGGGWRDAASSIVETLVYGGAPMEDFDRDFRDVDSALARSGLRRPTEDEMRLALSWWNRGDRPDVPYLVHADHLHIFTTVSSSQQAARSLADGTDCDHWPVMPDSHTLSFATVTGLDLPFVSSHSAAARWVSRLVRENAVAVSLRAKVEPSRVTRDELRRMRKRYIDDINERYKEGKMDRAEQEETLQMLGDVEGFYAGGGTPTLVETSTVVAFTGRHPRSGYDPTEIGNACGVRLASMTDLQDRAMVEMMIASHVRANPHVRDLPAQTVAYSGLPSLSVVGDKDGALVGFTERDGQPAYMAAMAATDADTLPIGLVIGQTGAGKSVAMTWLADQWARTSNAAGQRTPVTIFDPKQNSDFSAVVRRSGGQVYSLDSLQSADGVFDALRFSPSRAVGIELAASMLMAINPWGPDKALYETAVLKALTFGVQNGAGATLQALEMAAAAGQAPTDMVARVRDVADAIPMFRALCGSEPDGEALRVAQGITYIKVGDAHLDLPPPDAPREEHALPQRVAMAFVRAVAYGSMMAMTGRQGVLMLDEAWVFTTAGASEMERIGRLARSQQVFPMMFTQRVTDALNIGLAGYISRGIILPINDMSEAVAACQLFKIDPTPDRLARITARDSLGDGTSDSGAPNWASMRALRDPRTREVLRGTIGLYADLAGRVVPVEIVIPPEVLRDASTNRLDVQARRALEPELVHDLDAAWQ